MVELKKLPWGSVRRISRLDHTRSLTFQHYLNTHILRASQNEVMDTADLHPLVDELSSNIDDLEESLAPILKNTLSNSTSKLPLLDKAKLHVLLTYAIESVLFSCLRLNGVEAKSHPVFQELARVKEYFGKIKAAETAGTKRSTALDKEAASRFVKHGLAGNERYDRDRADRIEREKAGAKRKFDEVQVGTHTRFDDTAKRIKAAEAEQSAGTTDNEANTSATDETRPSTVATDSNDANIKDLMDAGKAAKKAAKRQRRLERKLAEAAKSENGGSEDVEGSAQMVDAQGEEQVDSQMASKAKTEALQSTQQTSSGGEEETTPTKKRRRKRKSKAQKLQDDIADEMK